MPFWNTKIVAGQSTQMSLPAGEQERISQVSAQSVSVPKKEPKRHRSETLKLRLSPEEKAYIEEQAVAAGMSKTDYIMTATKENPVIVIADLQSLFLELRHQGNNLNQAVRCAHQTQGENIPELTETAKQCSAAYDEIVALCKKWNVRLRKETSSKENDYGNRND